MPKEEEDRITAIHELLADHEKRITHLEKLLQKARIETLTEGEG